MWNVLLWDCADDSVIPSNDPKYFTVWGSYFDQMEAIEVRNDLQRDGCYAIVSYDATNQTAQ